MNKELTALTATSTNSFGVLPQTPSIELDDVQAEVHNLLFPNGIKEYLLKHYLRMVHCSNGEIENITYRIQDLVFTSECPSALSCNISNLSEEWPVSENWVLTNTENSNYKVQSAEINFQKNVRFRLFDTGDTVTMFLDYDTPLHGELVFLKPIPSEITLISEPERFPVTDMVQNLEGVGAVNEILRRTGSLGRFSTSRLSGFKLALLLTSFINDVS